MPPFKDPVTAGINFLENFRSLTRALLFDLFAGHWKTSLVIAHCSLKHFVL